LKPSDAVTVLTVDVPVDGPATGEELEEGAGVEGEEGTGVEGEEGTGEE